MARLKNYTGSITLISGLKPRNNGDFPLMEAHDIVVDEDGTRLDEKLANIGSDGSVDLTEIENRISAIELDLKFLEQDLEDI